jgi:hypothetical protein
MRIGRVQRQCRRVLLAGRDWPITTGELLRWSYPRVSRFQKWHWTAVRRAAERFFVRAGKRGYELLWAPKDAGL